jgi:hypothetical protein
MDSLDASDFAAFSVQSAAAGQAMAGALVRIAGNTYPATVPTPRLTDSLGNGVESRDGTLIARILISDLPTAPDPNQQLEWKRPTATAWEPVIWFIRTVTRSPIDVEWHLTCEPLN